MNGEDVVLKMIMNADNAKELVIHGINDPGRNKFIENIMQILEIEKHDQDINFVELLTNIKNCQRNFKELSK